jgi:hypothetical protein
MAIGTLQDPQLVQNQGLGVSPTPAGTSQVTSPYGGAGNMIKALVNPLVQAQNQVNQYRLQQLSQAGGPRPGYGQQPGQPMNIVPNNSQYGDMGAALFTQPPGGPVGFGTGSSAGGIW